ncbi:uncharacterized protein LOC120744479 isoform X2 [Simochromis diagramma]|uniref:uncharacterized protein LOC120744479 isoform X2 n=1 Tax=Simochromis diagramma TaxID=43689 RepID=UPI001A7EF744|nr:uncharacterized protein LOC120744479 isoform X2 [Simochromis diagramma]
MRTGLQTDLGYFTASSSQRSKYGSCIYAFYSFTYCVVHFSKSSSRHPSTFASQVCSGQLSMSFNLQLTAWTGRGCPTAGVFVQALSGQPVKCTVSHDGGTTTYALQTEFSDKDVQKPEFSWFNVSKYVLANHLDQIAVVISRSFNALTVRACIENLFCEGHVNSKGKPLDYTANCTTVCPPVALPGDQGNSHHWIIPVIVTVIVVIVIALACIILCCRNENLRRCRCGQTRGLYIVGKKEAAKPEIV